MFICTKPPDEIRFEPSLKKLGFQYSDGEFLATLPPHSHFEYHHSDDDDLNDRRKEAMHEAVRTTVLSDLKKFNIQEVFLHGESGTQVSQDKPHAPHVSLLATKVSDLRRKKDVIVVVGESAGSSQDAAIWAYRIVSRHGGTEEGSAVGMAARIQAYGQTARDDDPADEFERVMVGAQNLSLAELRDEDTDSTPGVVILNPGQLLYSHMENKSMSQTTWLARSRDSPMANTYAVDEKYNRVPGHTTEHAHISTVFEHVLPHLLRDDARIYLAIVGDSANSTLDYLDHLFLNKTETGVASQLQAVAIIEGNEDPEEIFSEQLKIFLASNGKRWIDCPTLPYGRLVQTPGTGKIVDLADYPFVDPRDSFGAGPYDTIDGLQPDVGGDLQPEHSIAIKHTDPETEYVDVKDEAYKEYARMEVLCPTFSAGDCQGIREIVFPRVMTDVLELFWEKKEKAESSEALCEIEKQELERSEDVINQPEQARVA